MSQIDPKSSLPESPEEAAQSGTLIASLALKQRAGGIGVPDSSRWIVPLSMVNFQLWRSIQPEEQSPQPCEKV